MHRKTGYMEIDENSVANLEILKPLHAEDRDASLVSVLDRTLTAMGGRTLATHAEEAEADDVTVEPVYCLGNCACAPAVMVDDRTYGRVDAERFDALLAAAREARS